MYTRDTTLLGASLKQICVFNINDCPVTFRKSISSIIEVLFSIQKKLEYILSFLTLSATRIGTKLVQGQYFHYMV